MKIGNREIGGHLCFIVAELGINHNGSTALAIEMTRAAVEAGADAVKVQAFSARHFCTDRAMYKGENQVEMFSRYELSNAGIRAIAKECNRLGVTFLGTPDCIAHAELLLDCGAPALKIGSDDLTNLPLIQQLGALAPLIISTGMGDLQEIIEAMNATVRPPLLQCVSMYPCPIEKAALNRIG